MELLLLWRWSTTVQITSLVMIAVFFWRLPLGATLLFFDLDGFKEINDRHGHAAGDETLRRFASALRESFRPSDTLVRYAGDEFVVVASGLDAASAAQRVASLRDRLRHPGAGEPPVSFSVGTAELAPGGHPESALRGADEAMYAAKRLGEGARARA
jgi:diguanylate cyclase (GGDEF)-like protein